MANTCYDTDLSQYSGTSQLQRALPALLAGYARVDERTTAQLILFAKKYGAYLNYFDATNQPVGDWQAFMSGDVSVTIAAIADWKAKDFSPFISNINNEVHDATDGEAAKKFFKTIFDLVFTLASHLDMSLQRLPDDVRYTDFLSVAITSNLALPLALLNSYYTSFRAAPLSLINETSSYIDPLMPVSPVVLSGDFQYAQLSKAWTVSSLTVPSITLQSVDAKDDISHVLTHNLFTGPLQLFINGIINIVSRTPAYLDETLNNYPSHEPHYALYLAFLRLFRFAQDHLNGFIQNHLDFYYKDVLQLQNRNAEPGFVHLLFELQKSATPYLLQKNTAFKAGKDATGNDITYNIVNDVVIQKATVHSLQSLYLSKGTNAALYASPVANSEDGDKITSADNSWFAFKSPKKTTGASLGFAIASNVLFLNEGGRIITFTFQCDKPLGISESVLSGLFTFRFTGKKDWFTATSYSTKITGSTFTVTISLAGDAPPIVPYSEKIHKDNFDTTLPIAQAMLNSYASYQTIKALRINSLTIDVTATVKNLSLQSNDGTINSAKPFKPFGDFPDRNASFIIGSEEVFQKHLTGLTINIDWQSPDTALAVAVVQNEPVASISSGSSFLTSPAQSFDTISAGSFSGLTQRSATNFQSDALSNSSLTTADNSFELQSAAQKVSDVSVNLSSLFDAIAGMLAAPADVLVLSSGNWSSSPIASSTNIRSNAIAIPAANAATLPVAEVQFNGNEEYDVNAISGFIKLRLTTSNYSLATYLSNSQKALEPTSVSVTYDGDKVKSYTVNPPKLPPPAPQLVANSISVTYSAQSVINFLDNTQDSFNNSTAFCYHTEPFGLRIMHPFLTDDAITFLPVFNLDNDPQSSDSGELWIGLQDAFPDETLSLLFQVSDGSSNPLKDMIDLRWFYLSNNNWLPFDKVTITDETNNLTRSGIVTLTLPHDITAGNTRADADLIWIKWVADKDTDAVNKLIAVRTNAAKAAFAQDLSKGIEYKSTLPASTISKPATAIAAIKKTEQPYPSFDGRLHEGDDRFYIRVSERLRHKHRAVTALDYERLVLDYFPQIHKTKCISHTGFISNPNTNETKYSQMLPGHVMVVTVPHLTNHLSSNLLRPYTSIGLIEEIQQYLQKLTSPFVKLHVSNPQFEEVQFDFGVTFLPNYDINFYTKLLNDEIEQFLTPWAYESGRDIEFGGRIEKSVVLNFVEERPYVDFVTCFNMNHIILREGNTVKQALYNVEEAVASTARSILVSYYNEDTGVKHLIQSPANCNCNG